MRLAFGIVINSLARKSVHLDTPSGAALESHQAFFFFIIISLAPSSGI
jgi:hypothetical protein